MLHWQRWVENCRNRRLTSFRPVVACATLPKHEVVRPEEAAEGTRPDRVHRAWLEVDENGARNVFVGPHFIVVDVDALELQVVVALVDTFAVDAVFV